MTIWQAIILGIVQGLTEFIPISSTAHLTLAGKAMGLVDPDHPEQWTAFIAVMQLGTLLAVVSYFLRDLVSITRTFIAGNLMHPRRDTVDPELRRGTLLGWMIIVGTLPIAIAGIGLKQIIEGRLTKNLWVIAASLIGLALILTLAELMGSKRRGMGELRLTDAILVGVAQVVALVPGSSRSGTTITGGLFAGLTREAAARFSFLLSVPAIAASGLLELPKALAAVHSDLTALAVATVVSAIFGYLSIAFLLRYLQTHTTLLFVVYRIGLGALLLFLLTTGRVGAY
jgi:undecaprenyl-diphosphatase